MGGKVAYLEEDIEVDSAGGLSSIIYNQSLLGANVNRGGVTF